MKKRRLEDLYVVGRYVEFDDGDGDPLKVYLRKLTPVDMELALRNANAAKSKYLAGRRDPNSPYYLEVLVANQETVYDRDACAALITEERLNNSRQSLEAELAEEEEWSQEGYLQGLQDAWLDAINNEETDSEDAERVRKELDRFSELVNKNLESHRKAELKSLESWSDQQLADEVMKLFMKVRADMEWLNELRRSEVWLALRESKETKPRYYENRSDMDHLPLEIMRKLMTEYQEMVVEVSQGKGSQRTQDSSASSALPNEEEVSAPSGQQVVSL